MPYVAQRGMRIAGVDYRPGEHVPAEIVPSRSLRNLLGRGLVAEVDAARPVPAVTATVLVKRPRGRPRKVRPAEAAGG